MSLWRQTRYRSGHLLATGVSEYWRPGNDPPNPPLRLEAPAGGQAGLLAAVETEAAVAPARGQSRTISPAIEAEIALAPPVGQSSPVGLALETEAALAPGRGQSRPIVPAVETETARAVGRGLAVGPAIETEAAFGPPVAQASTVSPAIETEVALDVSGTNGVQAFGGGYGASQARRRKLTVTKRDRSEESALEFEALLAQVRDQAGGKAKIIAAKEVAARVVLAPVDEGVPVDLSLIHAPRMPTVHGAAREWMPRLIDEFKTEYRSQYLNEVKRQAALAQDDDEVVLMAMMT